MLIKYLLVISICLFIKIDIVKSIKCTDHAFIGILQIEIPKVESLLPKGFNLSTIYPYKSQIKSGFYPVFFELGKQIDCIAIKFLPFIKTSFLEFKVEIPYVIRNNSIGPYVFKPTIFSSSELDTYSSRIVYGLPTHNAKMEMGKDYYYVQTKTGELNVSVNIVNETFDGIYHYKNFTSFTSMVNTPWFCQNFLGENRCASNTYNWNQAKIRPIKLAGKITGNLLGEMFNNFSFSTNGTDSNIFGSAEMIVPLDIDLPFKCPKNYF